MLKPGPSEKHEEGQAASPEKELTPSAGAAVVH